MAGKPVSDETQIFISYASQDAFEADLLQYVVESTLKEVNITAWTFHRDQNLSEKEIAESLKHQIKQSAALIILISPYTIEHGSTQWMELAYADSFDIKIYIMLHHLTYQELKERKSGVPPFVFASQCNQSLEWRKIMNEIKLDLNRS